MWFIILNSWYWAWLWIAAMYDGHVVQSVVLTGPSYGFWFIHFDTTIPEDLIEDIMYSAFYSALILQEPKAKCKNRREQAKSFGVKSFSDLKFVLERKRIWIWLNMFCCKAFLKQLLKRYGVHWLWCRKMPSIQFNTNSRRVQNHATRTPKRVLVPFIKACSPFAPCIRSLPCIS